MKYSCLIKHLASQIQREWSFWNDGRGSWHKGKNTILFLSYWKTGRKCNKIVFERWREKLEVKVREQKQTLDCTIKG